MAEAPATVLEVVEVQARDCARAGSPLYENILRGVADDLRAGGPSASMLEGRAVDPYGSALALRLLGAVHRIVLAGRAPDLAGLYPSVGGDPGAGDPAEVFLATMRAHRREIEARLTDGVQTNEVGRSAVLAGGHGEVQTRTGLPLRVLEVGASAGLNLRFDHYAYDTGAQVAGDPLSPVRFSGVWADGVPMFPERFVVVERAGCDRNPLDPDSEDDRLTLLSYTWPDQLDRIERLHAALRVAATVPVRLERADAAGWIEAQLATPHPGAATVVTHSIVLQYLSPERRRRFRGIVAAAGRTATSAAPVAWLRMEPAGERAELRLTLWPGGDDEVLASCGYHGRPIWWGA